MNFTRLLFTLLGIMIVTMATSQDEGKLRWAVTGSKIINFKADQTEIPIKLKNTPFTTIRLGFNGGDINMHHSTVHFENGEMQTIPMKKKFRNGKMSRIIDLHGGKRNISKIIIYYSPDHVAKHQVTVELWAKIEMEKNMANNR